MFKKLALIVLAAGVVGAALIWILSAPDPLEKAQLEALPPGTAKAGELVFWAGGCASCHARPKSQGADKLLLSGGQEFDTPFGVFVAPNISTDSSAGLGSWSLEDFANAMKRGIARDGSHYFPAFPYTSYARMSVQDVSDLWAFMKTLPADPQGAPSHRLPFPFNIRRAMGLWKFMYFRDSFVVQLPGDNAELERGRYLVEALGHCAACHTPRNFLGGQQMDRWLSGGASPEGKSTIPNITPHGDGIGSWSEEDIASSLETGFTPEYDSFGSTMADVQENMAKLPPSDRAAIAKYLKFIPGISSRERKQEN